VRENPTGFWERTRGARWFVPKGRRLGHGSSTARCYGGDSNRTSSRSDGNHDSPKQGKERFGRRRCTTARRRSAVSRHGKGGCAAAAFAQARAHGGVQMLGAHTRYPTRQERSKAGAFTPARSCMAVRRSRRRKETRCSRPAVTYGSTRPRRWRGHTESPKGLTSFPRSRMHSASRMAKAMAVLQAGRRGAPRKATEQKARPWPP
jgi:hypothetical protein